MRRKYLRCPDCGQRGVYVKLSDYPGEDCFVCRYCSWYAYTSGEEAADVVERWRLDQANEGL